MVGISNQTSGKIRLQLGLGWGLCKIGCHSPKILKKDALSITGQARVLRLAVLRELYEEANILVSQPHILSDSRRDTFRRETQGRYSFFYLLITENADLFPSMCQHYSCYPDISQVHEFQRWITPKQEKYRYDTYFYCIVLDEELTVCL